jgi:hypothetical protein
MWQNRKIPEFVPVLDRVNNAHLIGEAVLDFDTDPEIIPRNLSKEKWIREMRRSPILAMACLLLRNSASTIQSFSLYEILDVRFLNWDIYLLLTVCYAHLKGSRQHHICSAWNGANLVSSPPIEMHRKFLAFLLNVFDMNLLNGDAMNLPTSTLKIERRSENGFSRSRFISNLEPDVIYSDQAVQSRSLSIWASVTPFGNRQLMPTASFSRSDEHN